MNAIPKKSYNYERLQLPPKSVSTRAYSSQNIEYLDVCRASKLAEKKREEANKKREQEMQLSKRRELVEMRKIDELYNPLQNKQKTNAHDAGKNKKKASSQSKSSARKLTAAYAVQIKRPNMPNIHEAHMQANGAMAISGRIVMPKVELNVRESYVDQPKQEAVQTEPKRKGIVSTIFTIALVFIMLSAVLNMYAKQSAVIYQNEQTKNNIESLQKEIEKYEMEIASKEDLTSIQLRAQELGMGHPSDSQIVYLPVEGKMAEAPTMQAVGTTENAKELENTNVDINALAETKTVTPDNKGGGMLQNIMDGINNFFANATNTVGGWLANAKGEQ